MDIEAIRAHRRFTLVGEGGMHGDPKGMWTTHRHLEERVAAERTACEALVRAAGCACDFFADGDARWADCGFCQGRGYAPPSPSVACATCHGRGTVVENHDYRCPQALAAAIEARRT